MWASAVRSSTLRGEYTIEPLPNGNIRLHLASRHRISTDFNWYGRFWTDAVMADLQETILVVIQKRCEAEAHKVQPANLRRNRP
jgi:hypothetical protein